MQGLIVKDPWCQKTLRSKNLNETQYVKNITLISDLEIMLNAWFSVFILVGNA